MRQLSKNKARVTLSEDPELEEIGEITVRIKIKVNKYNSSRKLKRTKFMIHLPNLMILIN